MLPKLRCGALVIGARRLAAVLGDKVRFPHKNRCHELDVAGILNLERAGLVLPSL